MKPLSLAALALCTCTLLPMAHAETSLPPSSDKAKWRQLGQQLAECSAVYNLAATIKEAPDHGPAPYRELANNALVAGISATEHAGQTIALVESFYKMKYDEWEKSLQKGERDALLKRAQTCLDESLELQNRLVGTVRTPTATK
ncbi:MAG TPA: hypothetical protein VGE00_04535 [Gammaproteobacteria bacterium]